MRKRLERISEISAKRSIFDDTMNTNIDDKTVASLYADALYKPLNSTMMPGGTTLDKIMNATAIIEPTKPVKNQKPTLNETVTILSHLTIIHAK